LGDSFADRYILIQGGYNGVLEAWERVEEYSFEVFIGDVCTQGSRLGEFILHDCNMVLKVISIRKG